MFIIGTDFSSLNFKDISNKLFIASLIKLNKGISLEPILKEVECQWKSADFLYNGGCSIMAVRAVVVNELTRGSLFPINNGRVREFRKTGVRFSSSALEY